MISIAAQTETQRKAAAAKAAATRRRNAAKRSQTARKAAETRAQAQASWAKAFGWQAQRVADTALGAAVSGGEKVAGTVEPLRTRDGVRREVSRLQRRATVNLRKVERRGASARKDVGRRLGRQRDQAIRTLRRNRREAGRHVKTTRDDAGRRIDDAQAAVEDTLRRIDSEARNLA